MPKVVVITGASAGVGRATAAEFARQGYDVALLAREPARLEAAAADLRSAHGVRTVAIPTDVADAEAVEAAADRAEAELGPIDVWVNVAMATVFAPVSKLTAAEVERGTRVTYLGQVHGMMAALVAHAHAQQRHHRQRRLRPRLPLGAAAVDLLRRQSPRSAASPTRCGPRSSTTSSP